MRECNRRRKGSWGFSDGYYGRTNDGDDRRRQCHSGRCGSGRAGREKNQEAQNKTLIHPVIVSKDLHSLSTRESRMYEPSKLTQSRQDAKVQCFSFAPLRLCVKYLQTWCFPLLDHLHKWREYLLCIKWIPANLTAHSLLFQLGGAPNERCAKCAQQSRCPII